MRIPIWLTLIAALIALVVVVVIGQMLIAPSRPLIVEAGFAPTTITPERRRQRRHHDPDLRTVA